MPEYERPEPTDISAQFKILPLEEFRNFIKSSREPFIVTVDFVQLKLDYRTLQELMGENHIGRFTIRATEEEYNRNPSFFTIAGVYWERKE